MHDASILNFFCPHASLKVADRRFTNTAGDLATLIVTASLVWIELHLLALTHPITISRHVLKTFTDPLDSAVKEK